MSLFLLCCLLGLAVPAGLVAIAWIRTGRDPGSVDDPSILGSAPPPGMTAATATIVAGGPDRVAFMAALLDLAGRDEIAFRSEGRDGTVDRVGIAIRGGPTTDPRVLLDRRLPIGDAETWLLRQLRAAAERHGDPRESPVDPRTMDALGAIVTGMALARTLEHAATAAAEDDDSPAARTAREQGLAAAPAPDDRYIPAARARSLVEPVGFATLLGTYARRHGWVAGIPAVRRLRWRFVAGAELALAAVIGIAALSMESLEVLGLGVGVALGALVTFLAAGAMPARTREGALARTQLAAYARTLAALFAGATSMDEVVAAGRLAWLESPDQALVWGVALGLRDDVVALLERTRAQPAAGAVPPSGYVPGWLAEGGSSAAGRGEATETVPPGPPLPDPAAMFAGIEAIGSGAPAWGDPSPPPAPGTRPGRRRR